MELTVDNYIIDEDLNTILLTVKSQLTNGKLNQIRDVGSDIQVTCPIHNDGHESRPSCYVKKDSGVWHCFTDNQSGQLWDFIGYCFDEGPYFGKRWLIQNFGNLFTKQKFKLDDIVLNKEKPKKEVKSLSIDGFDPFHPYMKKRHLTDDVIRDFQIMYDPQYKAIVFPVKDKDGNIIAFTRRAVEGKKFYIDRDFDKSNLYAIDKAKNCDTIILVESQLNCLSLWGWGKPALATFGCSCPDSQISVLNSLSARHYIIAFDNDEAGKHGTLRLCQKLSKTKLVDVVIFNDNRDVNDLTKEEFESLKVVDRAQYKFTNK